MPRWFLSYHSPDEALARRLKTTVEQADPDATVFFAPAHLRAGGFWQRALADEIAQADAFILLVADSGIGNWQELEYFAGLDRSATSTFPLVLVLLEGQSAPGLPFLRHFHWIVTSDPASDRDVARLIDAVSGGGTTPGELWRYASPYRGLAAMDESNSDYFFARERETDEVLGVLAGFPNALPVIIGNSGVGKSSLAQAGVLASLKRQAWPDQCSGPKAWPASFANSRQWCFLTLKPGTEPLRGLVQCFLETWQMEATDPSRVRRQNGWVEILGAKQATLRDLLDATALRYKEIAQAAPAAFFLYVDQGEELYLRAERGQGERFSAILAEALCDPRFRAMMSLRADFLGELQKDETLFDIHRKIDLPPLRLEALRQVVRRPAALLSARFETDQLADTIALRAAEESTKDAGALPLLSYLLDDMWTHMVAKGDGVLRLPHNAIDLGRVLSERADKFLLDFPDFEERLRRILTLKLATVREGEEPTRRRALRTEFVRDDEWRLICALADHPYRLLVTATSEGGETSVEVAHEALFRRWGKLSEWIAAEREFLAWKSGLEAARRTWHATTSEQKKDALLMGAALTKARGWIASRRDDLLPIDQTFIDESAASEKKKRAQIRRAQVLAYSGLAIIFLALLGVAIRTYLFAQYRWWAVERPYMLREFSPFVLTASREATLKTGESFKECHTDCPVMIVVPAGSFRMGSLANDPQSSANSTPQHEVTIGRPFAVSKYDVTFQDWDACVREESCPQVSDNAFGHGRQPVINVSWEETQIYLAWLRKMTGKQYRLMSEAEWEFAARAGSTTHFYWGDSVGTNNADCDGCGSKWDAQQTAPVGSFTPNDFGLFDMAGNVWQWVEDCLHDSYTGATSDGSPWLSGDCKFRVLRGGAWNRLPRTLYSAFRDGDHIGYRYNNLGFRIARSIGP